MPATGGQPQLISQNVDYFVGNSVGSDMTSASEMNLVWSLDQKSIYFTATTGGVCRLFKVASSGGEPIPLTPAEKVFFGYGVFVNRKVDHLAIRKVDHLGVKK
ncbi:hypothetical protein SDC9_62479 [bioreactor metagenome]|uniref:Uncharacterized protein n=1 Tax=bioreactor metagenome TaxID=1076179 RepID=A0A644XIU4_9ZZZZ